MKSIFETSLINYEPARSWLFKIVLLEKKDINNDDDTFSNLSEIELWPTSVSLPTFTTNKQEFFYLNQQVSINLGVDTSNEITCTFLLDDNVKKKLLQPFLHNADIFINSKADEVNAAANTTGASSNTPTVNKQSTKKTETVANINVNANLLQQNNVFDAMLIYVLNPDGSRHTRYTIVKPKITGITHPTELAYDSEDMLTVSVTFQCDSWSIS